MIRASIREVRLNICAGERIIRLQLFSLHRITDLISHSSVNPNWLTDKTHCSSLTVDLNGVKHNTLRFKQSLILRIVNLYFLFIRRRFSPATWNNRIASIRKHRRAYAALKFRKLRPAIAELKQKSRYLERVSSDSKPIETFDKEQSTSQPISNNEGKIGARNNSQRPRHGFPPSIYPVRNVQSPFGQECREFEPLESNQVRWSAGLGRQSERNGRLGGKKQVDGLVGRWVGR